MEQLLRELYIWKALSQKLTERDTDDSFAAS